MDKEELKKKAALFGKKALEVGKVVGKYGAEAGKEIAKEAVVVGKALGQELGKSVQKFEEDQQKKAKWSLRQGSWQSKKILPQAFEDVQTQLRYPIGANRMNVHADSTIGRITAECSWNEDIGGFPNSYHQVNLQMDFTAGSDGTSVTYAWVVTDFPKGLHTNQIIRIVNMWMQEILENPDSIPQG